MSFTIKVPWYSDNPLAAAEEFFTAQRPGSLSSGDVDLLILHFGAAGPEHQAWRLAAVQALAREVAPSRANGVIGDDEEAVAATITWLENAPGVTGQLLTV